MAFTQWIRRSGTATDWREETSNYISGVVIFLIVLMDEFVKQQL